MFKWLERRDFSFVLKVGRWVIVIWRNTRKR